jgi:hypothetical protein
MFHFHLPSDPNHGPQKKWVEHNMWGEVRMGNQEGPPAIILVLVVIAALITLCYALYSFYVPKNLLDWIL